MWRTHAPLLAGVGGVGPSPAQTRARPSRFWHHASPRSTEREFIALCLEREARYPCSPAPGLNGLTRAHFCQGTQSAPPFPRLGAPPVRICASIECARPSPHFPSEWLRSSPLIPAHICTGTDRLAPAHISSRTAHCTPRLTAIGSDRRRASTGAEVRHVHPQERYATHAHAHAQLCKHACTHTRARTHTHNHAHVRTHSIAIATGRIFCCACIRHGEHTVVAGRISPYFFNFGNFRTGRDLYLLGR